MPIPVAGRERFSKQKLSIALLLESKLIQNNTWDCVSKKQIGKLEITWFLDDVSQF